ncbi:MAG: ABC transporter permease, partial [Planctomycetota bacterium]
LLLNVNQEIEEKTHQLADIRQSLEKGIPEPQKLPREEVLHHQKLHKEYLFNQQVNQVLRLPFQLLPHFRKNAYWHFKWFRKFLNELLFRAGILIFASGILIGGLISYFSLTSAFSGKAGLIQPILLEQLVSSLGLILWMALSPLFTALFLALRSGASIVGYLGNLKSSSQIDAFSALHIQPVFLLFPGIFVAFTLGIPLMTFLHFFGASLASLFVTLATQPNTTRYFWWEWYFSRITPIPLFWVFLKGTLSGLGVSIICYRLGIKASNATEANRAIQNTIFYSILYILLSFFILLVLEQRVLS